MHEGCSSQAAHRRHRGAPPPRRRSSHEALLQLPSERHAEGKVRVREADHQFSHSALARHLGARLDAERHGGGAGLVQLRLQITLGALGRQADLRVLKERGFVCVGGGVRVYACVLGVSRDGSGMAAQGQEGVAASAAPPLPARSP